MLMSMKSARLPKFGGEHKYLQVLWMLFKAYLAVYGFSASVWKTRDPDFPSGKDNVIYSDTTEGEKQEKAKKMNAIAITNLTTDFTSESLIGMVYQAITTEWPSELEHTLVDTLLKKYIPQYLVYKIELHRALNAISMKK